MLFKVHQGRAWKGLWGLLHQLQTMSLLVLPQRGHRQFNLRNMYVESQQGTAVLTTDSSRKCSKLALISLILATDRVCDSRGTSCFSPSLLNQTLI